MANKKLGQVLEDQAAVIDANKQVLQDAFDAQKAQANAASVDPTSQPQAATQADVNAQDAKTRLWQSLNNSYNQQRQQSGESYDQAISQTDRQLLSRGMGRSSYAGQTLANLEQKKAEAADQITSNQIADYQNRLTSLEQQEKENERWERQFSYQQERDKIADDLAERQFAAQQDQWKQEFDYNKKTADQQIAFNYIMNMLESGDKPSDALLKQAGITRKDYEQMKTKAKKTSGGGGRKGNPGTTDPNNPGATDPNDPWKSLMDGLGDTGTGDTGANISNGAGEIYNNTGSDVTRQREYTNPMKNRKIKGTLNKAKSR